VINTLDGLFLPTLIRVQRANTIWRGKRGLIYLIVLILDFEKKGSMRWICGFLIQTLIRVLVASTKIVTYGHFTESHQHNVLPILTLG
jgi:hypothetical protein